MTKHAGQSRWLKLLRTTAHLAIAAMWFIAFVAYLPDLLQLSIFQVAEPVEAPQYTTAVPSAIPNSAILVAAIGGLLILVLLFIVIKRFYIPATDKVVEHMTESAQKQVLISLEKRQPKLPKKEKQQISKYVLEITYLSLIAVPTLVLFVSMPIQDETPRLLAELTQSLLGLYATLGIFIYVWKSRIGLPL